jgi:hypothetical protein
MQDEMGRVCGRYGHKSNYLIQDFDGEVWREKGRGKEHLEDLGLGGHVTNIGNIKCIVMLTEHVWEGSLKIWWEGMECISLTQERGKGAGCCVNAVVILQVPQNAGNLLTNCGTAGLSRRALLHMISQSCCI